jgi:hypothetical protein
VFLSSLLSIYLHLSPFEAQRSFQQEYSHSKEKEKMHKFDNPTLQTKNYLDKIFCFCIKIFKFRRKGIKINQVLSCHIKKGTRMRKKEKNKRFK